MPRLTLAERKELIVKVPWIRKLKKTVPCEGIKWGKVALRDIYDDMPRGTKARGIQPSARCKRQAHWNFKALKRSYATSGNYCYTHLSQQIHSGYGERYSEYNRFYDFMYKNGFLTK